MKIIFAGTPEFAVPSLEEIIKAGHEVAAVITAPDKPSGRGLKLQPSPVKTAALHYGIQVFQPHNLKDENFLRQMEGINPDVIIVVAFRKMPQSLWSIPAKGAINLHASLLPQYRGAAPIHWAIINGETETGLTTFFINEIIDTGAIILQKKMGIGAEETAGELHDRMKAEGAALIVETLRLIASGTVETTAQDLTGELKPAPKIFKHHCRIDWNRPVQKVYNLIRGLSPYPAAFFELTNSEGQCIQCKVFRSKPVYLPAETPGKLNTDGKSFLHICCMDAWLSIEEMKPEGKNRMTIASWLNGIRHAAEWETAGNEKT